MTVANGATVSLVCGNANPTPYAEWPDPTAATVTQKLTPGAPGRGGLGFNALGAGNETLTDDARITATTSMNAASSGTRLVYQSNILTQPVRISGTPWLNLRIAFSKPKANLTGILISYPGTGGNGTILARGWLDPENRASMYRSDPITPGQFYDLSFDLQPKDMVIPAGRRLAFMILSSDFEHTLRPAAGHAADDRHRAFGRLAADRRRQRRVRGGDRRGARRRRRDRAGDARADDGRRPASFGAFTPGVAKDYTATTTATVISTAGDAALTVSDPGHLMNGTFALPEPLQVSFSKSAWTAPTPTRR